MTNDSTTLRTGKIELIKLVLNRGADPLATYEDVSTVLRRITEEGGILEPFRDMPNINLE
jgi:hypothetical protein